MAVTNIYPPRLGRSNFPLRPLPKNLSRLRMCTTWNSLPSENSRRPRYSALAEQVCFEETLTNSLVLFAHQRLGDCCVHVCVRDWWRDSESLQLQCSIRMCCDSLPSQSSRKCHLNFHTVGFEIDWIHNSATIQMINDTMNITSRLNNKKWSLSLLCFRYAQFRLQSMMGKHGGLAVCVQQAGADNQVESEQRATAYSSCTCSLKMQRKENEKKQK